MSEREIPSLTPRQEALFSRLYDDLLTFKFAKTNSSAAIRALVFEMVFKIDAFIEERQLEETL